MKVTPDKLASASSVFGVYFTYTRRHLSLLVLALVGSIVVQVGSLIAPLYLRQLFNLLATGNHSAAIVHMLLVVLGFIALWWVIEWAAGRVQQISTTFLESRVMFELFSHAFQYLIAHSYDFFISHFAGSLTHKVNRFGRAYETLLDSITTVFLPTLFFVSGAVFILFLRNHVIGIALGLWAIGFIALQLYVARIRRPIREARSQADTKVTGTLADAISNQVTILLFAGGRHEHNLFTNTVETWRQATLRSWLADIWTWTAVGIFILGIEIGLIYWAIISWQQGLLTIGDFVLIQTYLLTTFDRLTSIDRELRRFYDAYTDASEMTTILETPHAVPDVPGAEMLKVREGSVVFDHVSFYFHEDQPILSDFNLSVRAGEKIALVGPSGAGKTTITKLLLRLYDINTGAIFIDGQNIASVTQNSLRSTIAFVPQEPILFHRSLMENIRYGRLEASDEEIIAAAKKARCHDFIMALPQQYETLVGERGIKLSGGERQRVAIARAILKNAPILLLDEATSSLDSESEMLIQAALEVLMMGKTVMVIAHRLSTIMKMDRIVVLQHGTIVAQGDHKTLLTQDGLYQKLWSIQAGGFLLDEEDAISEKASLPENDEKGDELAEHLEKL